MSNPLLAPKICSHVQCYTSPSGSGARRRSTIHVVVSSNCFTIPNGLRAQCARGVSAVSDSDAVGSGDAIIPTYGIHAVLIRLCSEQSVASCIQLIMDFLILDDNEKLQLVYLNASPLNRPRCTRMVRR